MTQARVEITYLSCITWATIEDQNGVRPDPSMIGKAQFYVTTMDADGGSFIWWSGGSYEAAIKTAAELSAEGFGPIHDLVGTEDA